MKNILNTDNIGKKVGVVLAICTALYMIIYVKEQHVFQIQSVTVATRSSKDVGNIASKDTASTERPLAMVKGQRKRPKILIWAKQYHKIGYTIPELPNGDGGCDVTWSRNEYADSDAVVFYMKSCSTKDFPDPNLRRTNQAFIWWAHESPWTVLHFYHHDLKDMDNYFNWTMTYRADSDVLASFAPVPALDYLLYKFDRLSEVVDESISTRQPMSEDEFGKQLSKLMSGKTKFAAWIASDCSFTSGAKKRMSKVNQISAVLNFDKFGKCGTIPLPMNYTVLLQTMAPYKFYFAFENSFHCEDYITEKFFYNGLVAGTVPVVMGPARKDVEKIFPADAFIHVDDFENFASFAAHLHYLDGNDTAYKAYFSWWKRPESQSWPRYGFNYGTGATPETGPGAGWSWGQAIQDDMMEFERFGLYHLCRKLKNGDHINTSKSVANLNDVWYTREPNECING